MEETGRKGRESKRLEIRERWWSVKGNKMMKENDKRKNEKGIREKRKNGLNTKSSCYKYKG